MTGKSKLTVVCVAAMVVWAIGGPAAETAMADPVITDYKSTGGNPTNKDNDKDVMYLLQKGDTVTFEVTATGVDTYKWQVNKADQAGATSNTFTWTVPNEDGIWEIRLIATGGGVETQQEWAISTLSTTNAPYIFDYFTDCKSSGRTVKDPWERALPEWTGGAEWAPHVSRAMVDSTEGQTWGALTSTAAYGTWKFRHRFPTAPGIVGARSIYLGFIGAGSDSYSFRQASDSHHHCFIRHSLTQFSIDYDDGMFLLGKWYKVTIVRTQDGWVYIYRDDRLEFIAHDEAVTHSNTMLLTIMDNTSTQTRYFDCLEVHKNKYLFPPRSITFGNYVWNYRCDNSGEMRPLYKQGITIKGRGVTLADIATAVNDPAKFTYDAATKTAVCYTNLVVDEGAELIINGETLKFNCTSDGSLQFVPKYASRIHIENSTLKSTGEHYWVWNNSGSTTHYGYEAKLADGRYPDYYDFTMILSHAYYGSLTVKNSVIDNTAHMLFDSPHVLDITDSKFTNMREVDIGDYTFDGSYNDAMRENREFMKGNKGFWIHVDDLTLNSFRLKNTQFRGKTGPLNLTFMINAHRDRLNFYDLDLDGQNVVVKEGLAQTSAQAGQSGSTYANAAPYDWKSYLDSGLGLVNCKFNNLSIAPGLFRDCEDYPKRKFGAVKYYLDVKVVDKNGAPVQGATVTVANDVDDANYPAENGKTNVLYTGGLGSVDGGGNGEYASLFHHKRVVQGQTLRSTPTGADGHTPLPLDEDNTLIITDYVKKIEDSFDGIRILCRTSEGDVKYIAFDMFDDLHGNILHQVKYHDIKNGHKYHCKVEYQPTDRKIRLIVTNDSSQIIWDTGLTDVRANITPYNFDQIGFEVIHHENTTKEISYNSVRKNIKLYARHSGGAISAEVDNMKLVVDGTVVEDNDYSQDPNLTAVIEDGYEYYEPSATTNGKTFTWEFDLDFPEFKTYGPWVAVWLKKKKTTTDETVKTINYTYTITIEKDGEKKVITGVNPDATWYRTDPDKPTRTIIAVLDAQAAVCERHIFYNNSAFDGDNAAANANDDGAVAPDKTALLPGETATFANYISYSRGINGVMIDIAGLPGTPTAADFTFKVGNDNAPASWATAAAPTSITVREGAGVDGSDRITIIWADGAIQKQWLQVTVKATAATGLASDDVFYFGNAIGETGNSATDATVKPTDEIDARNNPHSFGGPEGPAGIDDAYDFNRDKRVGPTDEVLARNNGTNSSTALKLIAVP